MLGNPTDGSHSSAETIAVVNQPASHDARLPALDGLRGIAVLLVLVHHFVGLSLEVEPGTWQAYFRIALGLTYSGVDLFFVISGFLIARILFRHRSASNYYQVFYVRRFCRIFPLFYGFIALCWIIPHFTRDFHAPFFPLGTYLSFVCNFWMAAANSWEPSFAASAWSLAVEEQFYLVFPWVVRLCHARTVLFATSATILIAPLLRIGVLTAAPQYSLANYVLAPCRMDCIGMGILIAIALHHRRSREWFVAHAHVPAWIALAVTPVLAWLVIKRLSITSMPMAAIGFTVLGIFYAAVLLALLTGQPRCLIWICETRILQFFGRISYFVYLFQGLVRWAVFRLFTEQDGSVLSSSRDVALAALSVICLAILGSASWNFFESRLLEIGRRFRFSHLPRPGAILPTPQT